MDVKIQTMPINFDNTKVAFASKSDKELKKSLFIFSILKISWLNKWGTKFVSFCYDYKLPIPGFLKLFIFEYFCGGTTLQECKSTMDLMAKHGVNTSIDYGVEAKDSNVDFDATRDEFERIIKFSKTNDQIKFASVKITGICKTLILEKLNATIALTEEELKDWNKTKERLDFICSLAVDNNIKILIDAEETWTQKPVDELADQMMEKYNKEKAIVFNTFQLYRKDRFDFIQLSHERSKSLNYILGAKLVRGAYLEKETLKSKKEQYNNPLFGSKEETDKSYDDALHYCLSHSNDIHTYIASHNEKSNQLALELLEKYFIPQNSDKYHFAQLYGMSDHITFNIGNAGYQICKFLPYGPVDDVIPYLVRRAEENSSIEGQMNRELEVISAENKRRRIN